ncbi:expressed unknown protein [Ectocarpus siliculosus]|uniref:Uncharacterized protein n=1 Tax=Ectocarpus siliculosus TaxID=2880 RepID=D7FYW7_ECTSI|nr:expressed unknown protein [Ectocarpus siliculosus]|eukprot:CBJ26609.1 expressed unknown protein [Ectocarpus siliculosus]
MAEMYTARATSVLSPFGGGHCDSHAEPIPVQASKIELQPTIMVDRDLRRADLDAAPSVTEAAHLQERCVDMATELFELKTRFDEQEKELKWAKREAESRERDFKEVHRVCEEERRSSKSFMRRVKTLEEENSKLAADNADLRLDRERLLGVVRRYKDAGRKESVAAHRDRLRKRHMSEKEVNRCDLASAKLGLKAMGQENKRLLSKAKGQASRIRELENGTEVLAKKLSELEHELECAINQKDAVQQESDKALAQEQRAKSDMEHEALLRLQAVEQASSASRAEEEAKAAKTAAEAVIETLRVKLESTVKKLEAKDSARARHQGSVVRYQKMIDSQAMALQAAREQLLGEKVRRQESERQARLRHIAAIDSKSRAAAGAGATSTRRPASSPTARRPASRAFPASSGQGATRGTWAGRR